MTPVRSTWTTLTTSVKTVEQQNAAGPFLRDSVSFMFVFAGNGGVGILLLSSKNDEDDSGLDQSCARLDDDKVSVNGVTKTAGLCFLDDGVDWTSMRLSGE